MAFFTDVTTEIGIDFRHFNDFSPDRRLIETMGGGGTLIDFDNDGDLDLYLVQGNSLTQPRKDLQNRLYRNNGKHFTDVTEIAKVGDLGYGMGAIAGDYNNNGYTDLYVTNLGSNVFYRNNGNGTFTDVTEIAKVGCDLLSTSAAFGDLDNDGDLDLYSCNYVIYNLEDDVPCFYEDLRIYCGPNEYVGIADVLYFNDEIFTDVTKKSGVFEPTTRGLGVILTDIDHDRDLDIYVANDMTRNTLFINDGNGNFTEEGVQRGVAFNGDGIENGSMGIDACDYDNDGDTDLWVTNFSLEANCLMANDGDGYFDDLTFEIGLAKPSFKPLAFGTRFVDFDNDGWQDLIVGNGHIWDNVDQIDQSMTYSQPLQLFRNVNGKFVEITENLGFDPNGYVVRGLMIGDLDNDGDQDLILCQSNRSVVILRNEIGDRNRWLTIDLGPNAIGSRVKIRVNGNTQTKEMIGGSSYLVGSDHRLSFGCGTAEIVDQIEIFWLDGNYEKLNNISTNQFLQIDK